MLRISVTASTREERWILQGRLTKCTVAELVKNWQMPPANSLARHRIVDLTQVTSIDKSGEEVLLIMIRDGAEFVAGGLYTTHLLEALKARIC
jgi:anti-anti-sigma regulatory factor